MGRERQKRKNRSSISKVRQRTKSKKTVLNNPIIAANWDKTQTLSQNYKRMGLAVKLNKQSGGIEKKGQDVIAAGVVPKDGVRPDSLRIRNAVDADTIGLGEARVERDENGRIVRVVQQEEFPVKANPLNDPLNDLDSDSDNEDQTARALRDQHANSAFLALDNAPAPASDVVRTLQARASLPAAKYKRKLTENEKSFIEALVRKHGHEYDKMARDIKLNYMQRSEGDLKRRIKQWEDNGGSIT